MSPSRDIKGKASWLVSALLIVRRPYGLVQIGDTLAEDRTARVDTDIRTGQILLRPTALVSIRALRSARCERGGKGANQDKARHCYLRSERCVGFSGGPFAGCGGAPYRLHSLGWYCFYDADGESRRTGLEALPLTCIAVRRNALRIIPFGQASIEASKAGVVAVARRIESQDYGTGMLFSRQSCRVFCRIGKGTGRSQ